MNIYIKTNITITKPKKKKHYGYSIVLEEDGFKIKAKSASGKSRGVAGKIQKDGQIILSDKKVLKFLTPSIKNKIETMIELVYSNTIDDKIKFNKGLVTFKRK